MPGPVDRFEYLDNPLVDGQSLAGGIVSDSVKIYGYQELTLRFSLKHDMAMRIEALIECSLEPGGDFFLIQDNFGQNVSATTGALVKSRDVSSDEQWTWSFPIVGHETRVLVRAVGAGGDSLTVEVGASA